MLGMPSVWRVKLVMALNSQCQLGNLCHTGFTRSDLQGGLSVSDRERLVFTGVNGPLMARITESCLGSTHAPEAAVYLEKTHIIIEEGS